ncbi:MAG TPA: helix-turn-helix domain-containing protein [Mycobacteriales bacterium]|nr:helix-turn-helix domain-containing protein [Mycobacteriales bacterium]
MRRRLLDATISSLHELGYRRTTTREVQQRAGVSRGALLHHFASRSELIVAAMEHLANERVDEVMRLAGSPPPTASRRRQWAVEVLWSTFDGPLFTASLELWLAARTDDDLLAALGPRERALGRAIRDVARSLFGPELSAADGFNENLEIMLDAMRGAAARGVLRTAATDRRLLASWCHLMSGGSV